MNSENPAITVIIPNWNGEQHLATCLDSLRRQRTQDFQIILVDNGSTDGSIKLVRECYPEVRLVALDRNEGFSAAVNRGIQDSSSPFVALLNNDTEVDPYWLQTCLAVLEEHSEIGFVACQMLDFYRREYLDSAGDRMTRSGLPLKRGTNQLAQGEFQMSRKVLGASAGAAIYRRVALSAIGPFDSDYFLYLEDVDWSIRAALQGIRCLYVPEAKVYHIEAGSDPQRLERLEQGEISRGRLHTQNRTYWIARNRVRLLVKTYPTPLFLKLFPWIIYGFLRSGLFHLFKSGMFLAYCRGLLRGLREIPGCLPLRRKIQSRRRVSLRRFEEILLD